MFREFLLWTGVAYGVLAATGLCAIAVAVGMADHPNAAFGIGGVLSTAYIACTVFAQDLVRRRNSHGGESK